MRRRRRRRFQWFPILGAQDPNEGGTDDLNGRVFAVPVDGSGTTNAIIFPLVPDVQTDPDNANLVQAGMLINALSTDYLIERIVGSCFVSAAAPADDVNTNFPKVIQCGVGLFVARQADEQTGGGPDVPIAATTAGEVLENYNVLSNDTSRSPWMWQRTWILSTGRPITPFAVGDGHFTPAVTFAPGTGTPVLNPAPQTNMQYGSVMDGPHVDCKTNRRVRSNERLWCIAAARSLDRLLNLPQNPTVGAFSDMKGVISIRVLGATRKPTRRSSFG